jgi:hypothetical protein
MSPNDIAYSTQYTDNKLPPLHLPFTGKTKRSNTITNKTHRLYVSLKPQLHPLRKKISQLQLPFVKTALKQKKLEVPENCRADTFVLCGIAMGAVFSTSVVKGKRLYKVSIVPGNT